MCPGPESVQISETFYVSLLEGKGEKVVAEIRLDRSENDYQYTLINVSNGQIVDQVQDELHLSRRIFARVRNAVRETIIDGVLRIHTIAGLSVDDDGNVLPVINLVPRYVSDDSDYTSDEE